VHQSCGCDIGIKTARFHRCTNHNTTIGFGDNVGILCKQDTPQQWRAICWHAQGQGLPFVGFNGHWQQSSHPRSVGYQNGLGGPVSTIFQPNSTTCSFSQVEGAHFIVFSTEKLNTRPDTCRSQTTRQTTRIDTGILGEPPSTYDIRMKIGFQFAHLRGIQPSSRSTIVRRRPSSDVVPGKGWCQEPTRCDIANIPWLQTIFVLIRPQVWSSLISRFPCHGFDHIHKIGIHAFTCHANIQQVSLGQAFRLRCQHAGCRKTGHGRFSRRFGGFILFVEDCNVSIRIDLTQVKGCRQAC
jgi:hypothetical protein